MLQNRLGPPPASELGTIPSKTEREQTLDSGYQRYPPSPESQKNKKSLLERLKAPPTTQLSSQGRPAHSPPQRGAGSRSNPPPKSIPAKRSFSQSASEIPKLEALTSEPPTAAADEVNDFLRGIEIDLHGFARPTAPTPDRLAPIPPKPPSIPSEQKAASQSLSDSPSLPSTREHARIRGKIMDASLYIASRRRTTLSDKAAFQAVVNNELSPPNGPFAVLLHSLTKAKDEMKLLGQQPPHVATPIPSSCTLTSINYPLAPTHNTPVLHNSEEYSPINERHLFDTHPTRPMLLPKLSDKDAEPPRKRARFDEPPRPAVPQHRRYSQVSSDLMTSTSSPVTESRSLVEIPKPPFSVSNSMVTQWAPPARDGDYPHREMFSQSSKANSTVSIPVAPRNDRWGNSTSREGQGSSILRSNSLQNITSQRPESLEGSRTARTEGYRGSPHHHRQKRPVFPPRTSSRSRSSRSPSPSPRRTHRLPAPRSYGSYTKVDEAVKRPNFDKEKRYNSAWRDGALGTVQMGLFYSQGASGSKTATSPLDKAVKVEPPDFDSIEGALATALKKEDDERPGMDICEEREALTHSSSEAETPPPQTASTNWHGSPPALQADYSAKSCQLDSQQENGAPRLLYYEKDSSSEDGECSSSPSGLPAVGQQEVDQPQRDVRAADRSGTNEVVNFSTPRPLLEDASLINFFGIPPIPAFSSVPGLWVVHNGSSKPDITETKLYLKDDPDFLSLDLLCCSAGAVEAAFQNFLHDQKSISRIIDQVADESAVEWPASGSLILQVQSDRLGSATTFLPRQLSLERQLNLTSRLARGTNVLRFIQLRPMAHLVFVLRATKLSSGTTTSLDQYLTPISSSVST